MDARCCFYVEEMEGRTHAWRWGQEGNERTKGMRSRGTRDSRGRAHGGVVSWWERARDHGVTVAARGDGVGVDVKEKTLGISTSSSSGRD